MKVNKPAVKKKMMAQSLADTYKDYIPIGRDDTTFLYRHFPNIKATCLLILYR